MAAAMTGRGHVKRLMGLVASWSAAVLVHVLLLAMLVLILLAHNPDVVLPRLKNVLQEAGYVLEVEDMQLSLRPARLEVRGFALISQEPGRMAVRLPFFKASFSLMRGLRGGAWVREVYLENPDLRVMVADGDGGNSGASRTESLLTLLDMDRAMISNGTVAITSREVTIGLDHLGLTIVPDPEQTVLEGTARIKAASSVHNATASCRLNAALRGTPDAATARIEMDGLDFTHTLTGGHGTLDAEMALREGEIRLEVLEVNASLARLALPEGGGWRNLPLELRYEDPEFIVRAGSLLEAKGTMSGNLLAGPDVRLLGSVNTAQVLEGLRHYLPPSVRSLQFDGALPVAVSFAPDSGYGITISPESLRMTMPQAGAAALVTGRLGLNGTAAGPGPVSASVRLHQGTLQQPFLETQNATLALEAQGTVDELEVTGLRVKLPEEGYRVPGVGSGLGELRLESRLKIERHGELEVESFSLAMDRVGTVNGQGVYDGREVHFELASDPLTLSGLTGLAPEGTLAGWSAEGTVTLAASADGPLPRPEVQGEIAVRDLSLSSADGSVLAMVESSRLKLDRPEPERYRAILDVDTGECLVDTVYLNFAEQPLQAVVSAKPGADFNSFERGTLDLTLGNLFQVRGKELRFQPEENIAYFGRFAVSSRNLGHLFTTFVQDPFSASHPGLAALSVEGNGEVNVAVEGRERRPRIEGSLRLSGVQVISKDTLEVEGLEMELPLAYRFGLDKAEFLPPERPQSWGSLAIGRLGTPLGDLEKVALGVALLPNRLFVDGSLSLPMYGGELTVRDLRVERPLSAEARMSLRAALSRVNLQDIPVGSYHFQGHLSGDLGLVSITPQEVSVEGGLAGSFYNGDLRVTNIMARQPFSPSRVLGADVLVRGMDLRGFTSTLGAGLIFGSMDVDLDRFRLAYGQPVAFQLRAQSVETEGVEQEVSLRAVDSISVLGTGQGITSTAINIFRTFVQQFDYESIGIACTLQNDVFKVSGLIHDDGVEYLVKKPPLFGINVINRNPNNRISFRDMMSRVERVLKQENTKTTKDSQAKEAT